MIDAPCTRPLLDRAVADGPIPGVSLAVHLAGRPVLRHAGGLARREPARTVTQHTPFDLASLTKALAGAPVAASLVAGGVLDPDAPVAEHLPDVDPAVTLRHLLDHTSGLPAWAPLYARAAFPGTAAARRTILDAARQTPLEADPGTRAIYSDLGFLVLLDLLEKATGTPFRELFDLLVRRPARARGLTWGHPDAAATEQCPVRGHLVEGEVHDLNTAAMGGVSTHAGLFGTADAVAALSDVLLDPSGVLGATARTLRDLWATPSVGTHRGGWDTPSPEGYTSAGPALSARPGGAVGHLGYTGTSLWCVPEEGLVVVLLSNRVHPRDDEASKQAIRALRPAVHDAVVADLVDAGRLTPSPGAP